MNYLMWLLPFIVLVLSFVSFKANPAKGLRYKIYILILFLAFLLDLMSLSFVSGYVDTMRFLLITFIIGDMAFNVLNFKKIAVKMIFIIVGIAAFLFTYLGWIIDGPSKVQGHMTEKKIESYTNHKKRTYVLREHYNFQTKPISRIFNLYKIKKVPIIEEQVREYKLPEGYESSEFTYGWSNTTNGVRLDLINGKDTIWTLGEGF